MKVDNHSAGPLNCINFYQLEQVNDLWIIDILDENGGSQIFWYSIFIDFGYKSITIDLIDNRISFIGHAGFPYNRLDRLKDKRRVVLYKGDHDFPDVIMASPFYPFAYPFFQGKRPSTRIYCYAYE